MKNSKILPQIKKIDALILACAGLLLAVLCLVNYSNIDLEIQKYLFDFETKTWLIDKDEPVKKLLFYQLPKLLFGIGVAGCLVAAILDFKGQRRRLFLIFLGLSLIPLIAGNIKKFTNIYCPAQLEIYDGDKPYVRIFESYPSDFQQIKTGQCFPAGHAVVGFALMILFFAFTKKSHRLWGLATGLILGWITGFYQMAKGAHFLGDSLVSMLVCFLLAALIYKIYFQLTDSRK
jgi:membrane-associated PAP2 superfamily phosphatase